MRIRKNALSWISSSSSSFSSSSSSSGVLFPTRDYSVETQMCQLNQSPWDVMSFDPQSLFSIKEEENENMNYIHRSVAENGAEANSTTVSSLRFTSQSKSSSEVEEEAMLSATQSEKEEEIKKQWICQKKDGKGWQCKREAKQGNSLCDHHLNLIRSYQQNFVTPLLRRNSLKSAPLMSDYYYYSGFGPLWNKHRGETGEQKRRTEHANDLEKNKKKSRKPVKARSLNSLL